MPDLLWYSLLALTGLLLLPVIVLALPGMRAGGLIALVRAETGFFNAVSKSVGQTVAWLTLAMVLLQFLVVVLRYVYGVSFIAMQESILYAHGLMFTLAAAYTLLMDGHVRVDIFHEKMGPKAAAMVDLVGTLIFLVPFMLVILYYSWSYVADAWRIHEGSRESSGLAYIYLLKTVLLVFAGLLLTQGVALAGKSALLLKGIQIGDAQTGEVQNGPH